MKRLAAYILLVSLCACSTHRFVTTSVHLNQAWSEIPDSIYHNRHIKQLVIAPAWQTINTVTMTASSPKSKKLSSISPRICQLKQLERLVVSGQDLISLPACVYSLPNLQELDISLNEKFRVDSLLMHINTMKRLRILNLMGIRSALVDTALIQRSVDRSIITLILTKSDISTTR